MTRKGAAIGLLLVLVAALLHHVQLAQAVDACNVCTCLGTTVNCTGTSLSTIPSGIPVSTTGLYLASNSITSISTSAFTGLTALTELDLRNNQITSISANTFAGLPALNVLALSDNQITSISAAAFTSLSALHALILNSNPFTTLPPGLFKGLPNGLILSFYSSQFFQSLQPNNFTFGENAVAPPSTYGSASEPYQCDTACATCYASGSSSCCGMNCLSCTPSAVCTQCYEGFAVLSGSCVSLAVIVSVASVASAASVQSASIVSAASAAASASVASVASVQSASAASIASTRSVSIASIASIASGVLATSASLASLATASSASQASASVASAAFATSASIASVATASSASFVSAARASSASVASHVSAISALLASAASTASASAASLASSIAQHGGGGGSQNSSSSSTAAIAAAVASAAVIAVLALVFVVLRRRRLQRSGMRPKDSGGPIYQEAIAMTISSLNRSIRSDKEEDISAYAVVGQKQPEPLYQVISTSTSAEVVYDYASAYVAGSNSRRIREGLTIVKHLASGNFGDVALGQVPFNVLPPRAQTLLGTATSESVQVAVKSLKSNADDKSRQDFESEAKLMAPFVHPNVVRLLAALVESEPHLVLLEFVQYGDLRTLLQKSKLHSLWWTQNEQTHAIRQIALGMEYLGTLHFVHRDLAARNCLVGKGMVVKIADFGLSREMASENEYYRMQTRGKLPVKWMAPETMTFRKFSSMSDVWSFGVTAWECFSYGTAPYGPLNGMETLAHVEAGGRLPQPEHCSAEMFSLMLSCWDMSPEKRPTFSQLVKELTLAQDGATVREIGDML
ncbi:tyrosine-protein kinase transforming protein Fes [Capsaspora owczarzaki ATCC 30864]|uniref:TKL protein kinase n=1 Tax=Capsaspora owczarzaki (strain ATCC 30864) TaxID=595528 RepID=A0A0D2WRD3_CAPO3|nr:tyrosine-protein kinase transforming protein Fes [Capsaspora owczarzaki ATCC 30864]KJE93758.1 TKL protein kinase [Capsaspora owczarzaki ATCC 30864]KJE93759.1 TKL protein kinase, variant [Capsaspora owczarzaki ATCC 30864]|eukprot:XP_004348334.2 tyrosine-protein kinase transforming protein Fes [Capsaspora owczarzaki ATCC 30864]